MLFCVAGCEDSDFSINAPPLHRRDGLPTGGETEHAEVVFRLDAQGQVGRAEVGGCSVAEDHAGYAAVADYPQRRSRDDRAAQFNLVGQTASVLVRRLLGLQCPACRNHRKPFHCQRACGVRRLADEHLLDNPYHLSVL